MTNLRNLPVRFRILGVLFVMSIVNYLLRNNLSIAMPSIREEFGFTSAELGWILGSFNLSYALLQLPGGVWGELVGPRRAMTWVAVSWGVLTFLTGFAPALMAASATGALVSLIVVRFLLGVSNAPLYPVMSVAFERWFPPGGWAFANAFSSGGIALGQAALGPLVTFLIVKFGWRESFYVLAPLGVLCGAWWYWYGRNKPEEHPAITADELALINAGRAPVTSDAQHRGAWRKIVLQRDVLLLACSYFCSNYVFYMFSNWLFTYLVESRGFSLLEGGFLYFFPFFTGAIMTTVGGLLCDFLCRRIGPRWGCAIPAMAALILVGIFLLAGIYVTNPYMAVAMLSLCFGFIVVVEGPFWAAATYAGGPHTGAATGVLNTGGNIAGLLAPVIGFMIDHLGWLPTLASGSVFALIGAALWLFIGYRHAPASRATVGTSAA
jgi:ACS family glucarate transporter-like MFS transporter